MEKEFEIAKLQRLRCRADYPLRLFLVALGKIHEADEEPGKSVRRDGGCGRRSTIGATLWHSAGQGCPYCGRSGTTWRARRAGPR